MDRHLSGLGCGLSLRRRLAGTRAWARAMLRRTGLCRRCLALMRTHLGRRPHRPLRRLARGRSRRRGLSWIAGLRGGLLHGDGVHMLLLLALRLGSRMVVHDLLLLLLLVLVLLLRHDPHWRMHARLHRRHLLVGHARIGAVGEAHGHASVLMVHHLMPQEGRTLLLLLVLEVLLLLEQGRIDCRCQRRTQRGLQRTLHVGWLVEHVCLGRKMGQGVGTRRHVWRHGAHHGPCLSAVRRIRARGAGVHLHRLAHGLATVGPWARHVLRVGHGRMLHWRMVRWIAGGHHLGEGFVETDTKSPRWAVAKGDDSQPRHTQAGVEVV